MFSIFLTQSVVSGSLYSNKNRRKIEKLFGSLAKYHYFCIIDERLIDLISLIPKHLNKTKT
jgi:hypothetical protein